MNDRQATLRAGMAAIWAKSLPHLREQLDLLERAAMAVMDGTLDEELRRAAEREAHRLAGSAGSFGFTAASPMARELEHLFQEGLAPDARRVAELVVGLRKQLDTDQLPAPPEEDGGAIEEDDARARVLIVEDDVVLGNGIQSAFADSDIRARVANSLEAARKSLQHDQPDAILLDINLGDENGLDLLSDVDKKMPVFVMTAREQFTDRVEAVRKGARTFLQKPLPAREIAATVCELLDHATPEKARVLAVDDDKAILSVLRTLLKRSGFDITTIQDPRLFWDTLQKTRPDVVLLDYDMPEVTGLELCRIMRSDPKWRNVPVIFITGRTDAETITSTFEAGADDFIGKPIVNSEVVARVKTRVERARLLRQLAETDYLTGLMNRTTSEETLQFYQKLAERYSQPLSVALLDLDDFAKINETHGLAAGDHVLREFAALMRATFRGEDVVARWAGALFSVGMYGMGRTDAVHRMGEMLEALQLHVMQVNDDKTTVSFSAGVAQFGADGKDLRAVLKTANAAMQRAKAEGGARIMTAESAGTDQQLDVLVVEDDDSIAELLVHALETRGYKVQRLADGQSALDATVGASSNLRPRVVLLDVDLPGIDGISVLRKWKQVGLVNQMRVIMLTVRSSETEVVETLRLNAFDHMAKPFSTSVLMQRIRRALA